MVQVTFCKRIMKCCAMCASLQTLFNPLFGGWVLCLGGFIHTSTISELNDNLYLKRLISYKVDVVSLNQSYF